MNKSERQDRVAHLPAGKYYVGDPCYFTPNDLWISYLDAGTDGDVIYDVDGKTITLDDGRLVAAHGTAHGDGNYKGSNGEYYFVDAGLLGAVQLLPGEQIERSDLGTVVEFAEPFTVSYEDGTVFVGSISIDTDPEQHSCSHCGGELYAMDEPDICADCAEGDDE